VSVNGTLVEDKMLRFKGEFEHFTFNKCPIYTHDGASAKFSTNSQELDNSAAFPAAPTLPDPVVGGARHNTGARHCSCT
jgi:hypothetical protein